MNVRSTAAVVGLSLAIALVVDGIGLQTGRAQDKPTQYDFEKESIPGATASEPVLKEFSIAKAAAYIETGNRLWWKKRNCIACHTSGVYGVMRPALSAYLG